LKDKNQYGTIEGNQLTSQSNSLWKASTFGFDELTCTTESDCPKKLVPTSSEIINLEDVEIISSSVVPKKKLLKGLPGLSPHLSTWIPIN